MSFDPRAHRLRTGQRVPSSALPCIAVRPGGFRWPRPLPARRPPRSSRRCAATCRRSCAPRASTCTTTTAAPSSTRPAASAASRRSGTPSPRSWTPSPSRCTPSRSCPGPSSRASRPTDLADLIASVAPGTLNRVGLFNGGSEVTEGAVKLARRTGWPRAGPRSTMIISRWQGFHGMTLGATGFGGHTGRRRKYQPMLMDMPKIPPAYPYRCDDCAAGSLRCADELERMIKWQGPENVACFIVEPDRRRHDGGRHAAARLLPAHPPDLRQVRRPLHHGRGDDRLRADRALVRLRALGRGARTS